MAALAASLADLLHALSKGPGSSHYLKVSRILTIFFQICYGVASLHGTRPNPIAHRDLKPSNVLIRNQQCKLCDLGSASPATLPPDRGALPPKERAQLLERLTQQTTEPYCAPELLNIDLAYGINYKVDIWSLGLILYYMMYLKHPFQNLLQAKTLRACLGSREVYLATRQNLPFPEVTTPRSPFLQHLVLECLTHNPAERPDAVDILDQITTYVSQHPQLCPRLAKLSQFRVLLATPSPQELPQPERGPISAPRPPLPSTPLKEVLPRRFPKLKLLPELKPTCSLRPQVLF